MVTIVVTDVIPVLPVFFPFSIIWNENYFFSLEIEQENFANGLGFRVFKAFQFARDTARGKIRRKRQENKKTKRNF